MRVLVFDKFDNLQEQLHQKKMKGAVAMFKWMILASLLFVSVSAYAGCPFFTKPPVEYENDGVRGHARTNTWADGSQLCYNGIHQVCEAGYWRPRGTGSCKTKWGKENDAYMLEGTKNPNDDEDNSQNDTSSSQNDDDNGLFGNSNGNSGNSSTNSSKSCFDKCDENYMQKQFSKDKATCMKSKDPDRCLKETLINIRKYCQAKCN